MKSAIDPSIFRAYDIRGIVDKTLTEDSIYLIGKAVATRSLEAGVDTLVIGRDGRLSGPRLASALANGIRSTGANVIDIGPAPTPVVYYASHKNGGSGIVLTGSHNPPDYNGCKIMVAGTTLAGDEITSLYELIVQQQLTTSHHCGTYHEANASNDYLAEIKTKTCLQKPISIVADYGNGIAGGLAPQLFKVLDVPCVNLFAEVDGHFPNHHPDPSKPENLLDLKKALLHHRAEIGFAFDGDGDRLGVVIPGDSIESCEVIWADRVLKLFAEHLLDKHPGNPVIFDVKCTGKLFEQIEQAGGKPVMWRTGHSLIKRKMRELNAPLAGEMSGHFFFGQTGFDWYGFDDALFAAAKLLEILSQYSDIGEVLRSLPSGISTPELDLKTGEGENHQFIRDFQVKAQFNNARLTTIDGVRADFDDGWGLIRASNTTPSLVLRFEADNENALLRIQNDFRTQIQALAPRFDLPF